MKKVFALMFSFLVFLSGCSDSENSDVSESNENNETSEHDNSGEETVKIVTTIAPLYSFTANLTAGVENVEISNIVPPNTSVHSYSLTPETAKKIEEADLIVVNGLELEEFLEDTLEESSAQIVDTSEGVDLIKFAEEDHEGEDSHEDEDGEDEDDHHHGEYDPHIWLSPLNAKVQTQNITESLVEVDPENAEIYQRNLEDFQQKLDDLNAEIQGELEDLEIGPYVVFHDAYGYFEENFGIEAVAYLEEFPGQDPTAEYLAEIIEIIEENNVKVVFTEPQFSPKLVKTLSDDYDLNVAELDPLGQEVSEDGYFQMMKGNLNSFKEFFGN